MNSPNDPHAGSKNTQYTNRRILLFALTIAILGVAFGLGVYTLIYAKGTSYLSDDPRACANCHVMREVLNDWQKGDHHHVAVCNDCHVPHSPVTKWLVKGLNGFHHSYAFTFLETPVTIEAGSLSQKIVQKNCERCHEDILFNHLPYLVDTDPPLDRDSGMPKCIRCHRQVGHVH